MSYDHRIRMFTSSDMSYDHRICFTITGHVLWTCSMIIGLVLWSSDIVDSRRSIQRSNAQSTAVEAVVRARLVVQDSVEACMSFTTDVNVSWRSLQMWMALRLMWEPLDFMLGIYYSDPSALCFKPICFNDVSWRSLQMWMWEPYGWEWKCLARPKYMYCGHSTCIMAIVHVLWS